MIDNGPTVKYGGVEIVYDEQTNKWVFELDGQERRLLSLASAKSTIDAPRTKKAPFEKIPCYLLSWGDCGEKGFVTSVAEKSGYESHAKAWFVGLKSGNRSKEPFESLIQDSEGNRAMLQEIKAIGLDIEALQKERDSIKKRLVRVKAPDATA